MYLLVRRNAANHPRAANPAYTPEPAATANAIIEVKTNDGLFSSNGPPNCLIATPAATSVRSPTTNAMFHPKRIEQASEIKPEESVEFVSLVIEVLANLVIRI